MKRYYTAFIIIMLFLLQGCNTSNTETGKYGGTIYYGKASDPVSLDPATIEDNEAVIVTNQIFESLLDYLPGTATIVPKLAESYSFSEDGKLLVFKLRKDVKFHDGTVMNADAVLFSLGRQHYTAHRYYSYGEWKMWETNQLRTVYDENNTVKNLGFIKDISKIDDYTIEVSFNIPDASVSGIFASHFTAIVSPYSFIKYGHDFKRMPIGTGPFKFREWKNGEQIILAKNNDYWGKKAYVDSVVFKVIEGSNERTHALINQEIHMISQYADKDLDMLRNSKTVKMISNMGLSIGYIALNCEKGPFSDKSVRIAINHAIDKKAIIKNVYKNEGILLVNPLPKILWGYNETINDYKFDPINAKKILSEAGYEKLDLTLLALPTARPYNPDGIMLGQLIQKQLEKIGVKVNIISPPISEYWSLVDKGEFDMAMTGWTGFADPDNYLYHLFTFSYLNSSRWINEEYIKLVAKAKGIYSSKEREKLYHEAQIILFNEAPIIMLANNLLYTAVNKKIQGYIVSPLSKVVLSEVWLKK